MKARTAPAWLAVSIVLAVIMAALPACKSSPKPTLQVTTTTTVATTTAVQDTADDAEVVLAAPPLDSLLPADGSNGVSIEPTLTWAVVTGANDYQIAIAEDAGGDDPFAVIAYDDNTVATTHAVTMPLKYSTAYRWRVRAIYADGSSPWVSSSFTTETENKTSPPPVVTTPLDIISPLDGAIDVTNRPTLSWEERIDAIRYELIIAEDTGGDDRFASVIYAASTTTNSHVAPEVFTYGTTYNWRVRPVDSSGTGPWAVSSFTTETRLVAPAPAFLVPPPGGANVSVQGTLSWAAVPGAKDYELVIAEKTLQGDPFARLDLTATTAHTKHTIWFPLKYSTEYNWRVRARDVSGIGPWATSSFTTEADLSLLQQRSLVPASGQTGVPISLTFSWDEVFGATSYEFDIAEDIGASDPFANIEYSASLTGNSHLAVVELKYGVTYNWRVRAVNNVSGVGPWITSSFTAEADPIPLAMPVTKVPEFGETGVALRPTLGWSSVEKATGYEIEIADGPFSDGDYRAVTLTTFHLVAEILKYETTYSWRVRAVSASGPGPWSTSYFITEANPTP